MAYKLQLPEGCLIYPVFHVSQLKPAVAPHVVVTQELPDPSIHFQVPQTILDRRLHVQKDSPIPQVLVKCSHLPTKLSTWKMKRLSSKNFLEHRLGGKPSLKEGGMSPTPSPAPRYTAIRLKTLMILTPMLSTVKGQGSPIVESTAQTGCEAHLLLLFRLSPCNG